MLSQLQPGRPRPLAHTLPASFRATGAYCNKSGLPRDFHAPTLLPGNPSPGGPAAPS